MRAIVRCFVTSVVVILSVQHGGAAESAGAIAWGAAQNGVRVGLALVSAKTRPTGIRVVFENTGAFETGVLVGARSGLGTSYNLAFTAIALNGQVRRLLNSAGGGGVGGYLSPVTLKVPTSGMKEVVLPLNQLFCVIRPGQETSLDTMLQEGYSVHVSLEVGQERLSWVRRADPAYRSPEPPLWSGVITSGELRVVR